jgi:hypothetical protein
MRRRHVHISAAVAALLLLAPRPGLAVEYILPTEGSYVHQIAHLLFAAALVFFIREIYRSELKLRRGFRRLAWGCGLLTLWNLDAIIGHWADWTLSNPVILGEGWGRQLLMYDFHTWLVYITKINHFLLLASAFILLYMGMLALVRDPFEGQQ